MAAQGPKRTETSRPFKVWPGIDRVLPPSQITVNISPAQIRGKGQRHHILVRGIPDKVHLSFSCHSLSFGHEPHFPTCATEQDPSRPSQNRPPPIISVRLLSAEKLQRINLIREVRKCRKQTVNQDKIIIIQP